MKDKKVKVEILIDDKPVKDIEIDISREEQNFFERTDFVATDIKVSKVGQGV